MGFCNCICTLCIYIDERIFETDKEPKKVMKFVQIIVVILAFAINKITKMRNAEADLFTNDMPIFQGVCHC